MYADIRLFLYCSSTYDHNMNPLPTFVQLHIHGQKSVSSQRLNGRKPILKLSFSADTRMEQVSTAHESWCWKNIGQTQNTKHMHVLLTLHQIMTIPLQKHLFFLSLNFGFHVAHLLWYIFLYGHFTIFSNIFSVTVVHKASCFMLLLRFI